MLLNKWGSHKLARDMLQLKSGSFPCTCIISDRLYAIFGETTQLMYNVMNSLDPSFPEIRNLLLERAESLYVESKDKNKR